jgi:hypothetical protein
MEHMRGMMAGLAKDASAIQTPLRISLYRVKKVPNWSKLIAQLRICWASLTPRAPGESHLETLYL